MKEPGRVILQSVVVARAIALAEPRVLKLSPDDLELLRIRSDVAATEVQVSHLVEQWGETIVEKLLELMNQTARLFKRTQRVRQRNADAWNRGPSGRAWAEASRMLTGPLNEAMRKISEAIVRVRHETDLRA